MILTLLTIMDGPDINQFKTFFNNVCSENELLSF